MKKLAVLMMMLFVTFSNFGCNQPENRTKDKKDNVVLTDKIEVFYFHFSRRCATCNAVESVTKEALADYFADKVKSGKISFKSVNLDEDAGKKIAEKYGVSGQTLLFVSNSEKINLTNDGFMYAKNQPDKLKEKVKETIQNLLK